jgi:hypothetical protein
MCKGQAWRKACGSTFCTADIKEPCALLQDQILFNCCEPSPLIYTSPADLRWGVVNLIFVQRKLLMQFRSGSGPSKGFLQAMLCSAVKCLSTAASKCYTVRQLFIINTKRLKKGLKKTTWMIHLQMTMR